MNVISDAKPEHAMSPIKVGMICFLMSEAAFFSTLMMAYVFFLRQTRDSVPNPATVFDDLKLTLAGTACLLASSGTMHLAEKALHKGDTKGFLRWWGLTLILGVLFILGTAWEWRELIHVHKMSLSRNMFGTTYFTLVGFHAAHVTVGLILIAIIWTLFARRQLQPSQNTGVTVISWYWHFVDVVWILVFTLVYIVGR